ncbi:MAG: hypothetical protein R2733_10660 [Acidimicrobiales bacterium]
MGFTRTRFGPRDVGSGFRSRFAAMIAESMTNVSSARANRQQLHERVTGAGMDCGRSSVRLFRNSQLKNAPPVPASVWTSLDSVLALDRSLGLHQGADRTGRSQLGFLTEALQNAYEHGLSDGSKSLSGRVLLSARSINLHDEADALGDGDPIGAHIRELSAGAGLASAAVWTVFDQGVGVSAKYSGRERDPSRQFVNELADLHQAMSPGKSSARTKFSASRGLGFKNMGQAVVGERGP